MANKQVPMPVMIAIAALAVVLLGYYGFVKLSPPGYATNKETGVPAWVKDWKPAHETSSTSSKAGSAGAPANAGH